MKTIILLCASLALCLPSAKAAALSESKVTEIIKEVNLLPAQTTTPAPAKLNDLVKAPDRVRTGAESRTELTAADNTITRIGANTIFSFENAGRTVNLEQGSLLFHSPKGAGGGKIKSGGASAAVLGTTLIVAATLNGGFKVIVLEGRGSVTLPNGRRVTLRAGQMVFVMPAANGVTINASNPLNINLGRLVAGSLLVNGFSRPLPSQVLINAAVEKQNYYLARGRAVDTGIPAEEFATATKVAGNGLGAMDLNSYQTAVHPAVTATEFGTRFTAPPNANGQKAPGFIGGPGGSGVIAISGGFPPSSAP
jgi:hypothetical protein